MSDEYVMSKTKDPFALLDSPARNKNAEWVQKYFNELIIPHMQKENIESIHVRDIHYTLQGFSLVRPNGDPYLNDAKSWDFLVNSMRDARFLRLVPFEMIRDNKNVLTNNIKTYGHDDIDINIESANNSLTYEGILDGAKDQFSSLFNKALYQDYYVEFWTEKSLPILEQVAYKYRIMVNLVEGEGEISLTQINDLCNRVLSYGKPVRIGYLGDFDVIGLNLARAFSRKLEYFIREYSEYMDLDIKVKRLMILPDQVREFDLPLTPMKDQTGKKKTGYTTRKLKFYEDHGLRGAVELNTLHVNHSNYFRDTLEKFVTQYYDIVPNIKADEQQDFINSKVDSLLRDNIEEFSLEEINWDEVKDLYNPDDIKYTKTITENAEDWLFDSKRSSEEQADYYDLV